MVEDLYDIAVGNPAVLFGIWLGKRQSRVMLKRFEDPLDINDLLSMNSINRARFLQFWGMKENICKFRILYLKGGICRDDSWSSEA